MKTTMITPRWDRPFSAPRSASKASSRREQTSYQDYLGLYPQDAEGRADARRHAAEVEQMLAAGWDLEAAESRVYDRRAGENG
jgi:hypothetical protein